ncbi:MAG: RNA polymerase sigma factor [Planctomycetaceae bacterium]
MSAENGGTDSGRESAEIEASSLGDSEGVYSISSRLALPASEAGALYLEYGERLLAFAFGILGQREVAREVVQATFEKALRGAGGVPPEARKAWLYKVARNEALLARRRQGAEGRAHERKVEERRIATASEDDSPLAMVVQGEQVRLVREALSRLPVEQRDVVERRIYHQQTFAEIAAELAVPVGTVLTRMRLAVQKLSEALRERE